MPQKGDFLTADGGRAELDQRRARIHKNMFVTSDGPVPKRPPLPDDLREFEAAAAEADRIERVQALAKIRRQHEAAIEQQQRAISELSRRFELVRSQLQQVKRK